MVDGNENPPKCVSIFDKDKEVNVENIIDDIEKAIKEKEYQNKSLSKNAKFKADMN